MTDIEAPVAMIQAHNLFSSLRKSKILELANLAIEKICGPQELITREGDVVDAVYLATTGEIEINVAHLHYRAFRSLHPLRGRDGYLALKDALDDSILRFNAFNWLRNHLPFVKSGIAQLKSNRSEKVYWLACFAFFLLALLSAFVAQHYLRLILAPSIVGISTSHLAWILPGFVVARFVFDISYFLRKA